ncbi:MAG: glycosyltransferase family 2 protein, partial [Cytophagales bacterium]|nr:glycosyltransferase family 2 protein [Cytophagales bacterium]
MSSLPDVSIIVPLYNEEESLPELTAWIDRVCKATELKYELLLIDDGSTDRSWDIVKQLASEFPSVKGHRLITNYGKSAALNVGFQACRGQVVITMDADLQDSPDEIPSLYNMIKLDGYDLVSGWKKKRYDPIAKTIPSKFFNYVTSQVSGIKLHDFNCGLKAYRKDVVKRIEVFGEMHRYIPVIAKWSGFKKIAEKVVEHRPRKYGVTKFGLERFVFGFLDLLSISFVTRFKKRPMHFFGSIGTFVFLGGLFISLFLIVEKQVAIYLGTKYRNAVDHPPPYLSLVAVIVG